MIPDKTQELDLRELLARYEREYGSEAEREFFGQDWTKLVARPDAAESDAESDAEIPEVVSPTPNLSRWVKWSSVSLLIGSMILGLGWVTLGARGETDTASPPASPEPSSQGAAAHGTLAAAPERDVEPTVPPTPRAPFGVTLQASTTAATPPLTAASGPTTLPLGHSSPHHQPTDAEPTLARRAVDAVLAGDRAKALELYRELSRRSPESEVYREAARILARSPELSSNALVPRHAAPSLEASKPRTSMP